MPVNTKLPIAPYSKLVSVKKRLKIFVNPPISPGYWVAIDLKHRSKPNGEGRNTASAWWRQEVGEIQEMVYDLFTSLLDKQHMPISKNTSAL